jgi:hypothetical protein
LESTKRGIFTGEDTAGNKIIISGDPTEIVLRNTKMIAQISALKSVIQNSLTDRHRIMPIYYMATDLDAVIMKKDRVKDFAWSLISINRQ